MRCAFMDRECNTACQANVGGTDDYFCRRLGAIRENRDSLRLLSRSMESIAAVLDEAMTLAELVQNPIIKRFLPKGSKGKKS